jgi:hypothetical protein
MRGADLEREANMKEAAGKEKQLSSRERERERERETRKKKKTEKEEGGGETCCYPIAASFR